MAGVIVTSPLVLILLAAVLAGCATSTRASPSPATCSRSSGCFRPADDRDAVPRSLGQKSTAGTTRATTSAHVEPPSMADVVVPARTTHTGTVIFIHGLGDTAAGWVSEMRRFNLANPHLKFILPTAPKRPVTISYGQRMPAWYDIKTLSSRDHEDFDGLPESSERIEKLIKAEVENGIPASRVVVGGFSQGAALSLFTGFRLSERLGGIIAMSGYLPIREQNSQEYISTISENSKDTPLLMCHGTADNVVRYEWGQKSFNLLKSGGVKKATLRSYPNMAHSACAQELDDIQDFLTEVLPPLPADGAKGQ